MTKRLRICLFTAALLVLMFPPSRLSAGPGRDDDNGRDLDINHVLLISIDGMHAVDYLNCKAAGTCPTLAALGTTGVSYTNTSTSKPSDSFPGLMALVTGGTPRLVGAYYDVAYDRVLAPPSTTTGNGNLAGSCDAGKPNGTTTEYEEGVDIDQTQLNGGGDFSNEPPALALIDGDVRSIDPTRLPRDPFAGCAPVYPWNFIRANTIYGVIHKAGGFTAWSDKHAVYAAVSGPTGTSQPSNVDDYYAPDINSNIIGIPNLTTADGLVCDIDGNAPDNNGGAWTDSFQNVRCYDQLKVNAVLNWIDGKTHLGDQQAKVPTIFGMNFQAVSVGQKLIETINGMKVKGGYLDAAGTPSLNLKTNIAFVDRAIFQMVSELKSQGLFDSTVIIVTAKHGQSPIDPAKFQELGNGITSTPADLLANQFLPQPGSGGGQSENPNTTGAIGPTQDDISLLWLAPGANTEAAVDLLHTNSTAIQASQIFSGDSLEDMFGKPGVPKNLDPCCHAPEHGGFDSRTPNIIVQPVPGVIYTGSHKKQEEHGGFAHDDTNVMILVSNPGLQAKTVDTFVETRQVAPTILRLLGLDPRALDAVRLEGTQVLPNF
jgi:hypothetical protein